MTSEEFITKINELVKFIKNKNTNSEFVFIAPFTSLNDDKNTNLTVSEKNDLMQKYSDALKEYSNETGATFIDINAAIINTLNKEIVSDYMLDAIHPNSDKGIKLYAELVMRCK